MEFKQDETMVGTQETSAMDTQINMQPVQSEWGQYAGENEQYSGTYNQTRMSKKEFYKQPSMKKIRGNINACGIFSYISATLTFLVNVVLVSNIFGMLDVILIAGLGMGVQLGKSRVCSIILLAYACLNTIYTLIATGRLGGYLILICGIIAVMETFKFHKAWAEYEKTGIA